MNGATLRHHAAISRSHGNEIAGSHTHIAPPLRPYCTISPGKSWGRSSLPHGAARNRLNAGFLVDAQPRRTTFPGGGRMYKRQIFAAFRSKSGSVGFSPYFDPVRLERHGVQESADVGATDLPPVAAVQEVRELADTPPVQLQPEVTRWLDNEGRPA